MLISVMIIFGTFDYCEFVLESIRSKGDKKKEIIQNGHIVLNGLVVPNARLIRGAMFYNDNHIESQFLN